VAVACHKFSWVTGPWDCLTSDHQLYVALITSLFPGLACFGGVHALAPIIGGAVAGEVSNLALLHVTLTSESARNYVTFVLTPSIRIIASLQFLRWCWLSKRVRILCTLPPHLLKYLCVPNEQATRRSCPNHRPLLRDCTLNRFVKVAYPDVYSYFHTFLVQRHGVSARNRAESCLSWSYMMLQRIADKDGLSVG
jgi:hypothetical protein